MDIFSFFGSIIIILPLSVWMLEITSRSLHVLGKGCTTELNLHLLYSSWFFAFLLFYSFLGGRGTQDLTYRIVEAGLELTM